jgi:hypothetical protein
MPHRDLSTFGLSARTPEILPANTMIDPAMLPESLPQDHASSFIAGIFGSNLRHLGHTKKFLADDSDS